MTKNKSGFTLIELLVTVAIIAVVSAIGIASYQIVNKNARDAKRVSDLRVIQSALEQYHADNLHYPNQNSYSGTDCPDTINGDFVFGCPLKSLDASKTYLSKIPNDADPYYKYVALDQDYGDTCGSNCPRYCLYANLENPGTQERAANCTSFSSTHNFAVVAP